MRILKVTPYYYPDWPFSGPATKIKAIAEMLVQRGHQVTVLTPSYGGRQQAGISYNTATLEAAGSRVIRPRTILRHRAVTLNPSVIRYAWRQVQSFDVIHVYGYYDLLAPVVCYYARRYGIPYVLEPLGMLVPVVRSLKMKRLYHEVFGKRVVAEASRIIVTSEQERTHLISANIVDEARIVQRRNGIDLSEFSDLPARGQLRDHLGIERNEPVILYLGRIAPIKSLDLLLRAFSGMSLPGARLLLAGPDEGNGYLEGLKGLCTELGLDDHVLFLGPLYGDRKLTALVDADAVALTSQRESFGNVVAEAIAAGTPVVITDRCGIASYVRDRVGLVVAHNQFEVRDAIVRLLTDEALYQTFKANCSEVAKGFSWDEPLAQMEALYTELISIGDRNSGGNH